MVLATINNEDITRYIDKDTYKVNAEDIFESWENGNFKKIRIPIRKRVKGSFQIKCGNGLSYQDLLDNLEAVTTDDLAIMGVWVMNENKFELIETFYAITGSEHVEHSNGGTYDVLTIEIEES